MITQLEPFPPTIKPTTCLISIGLIKKNSLGWRVTSSSKFANIRYHHWFSKLNFQTLKVEYNNVEHKKIGNL